VAVPAVRIAGSLSVIAAALLLLSLARRDRRLEMGWRWAPLVPLGGGLAAWFFTAPDPRFGDWLLWLLAGWLWCCVLWVNRGDRFPSMARTVAWSMTLAVLLVLLVHPVFWFGLRGQGFARLPQRPTEIFTSHFGAKIIVPVSEEEVRLWDSPLPSAPLKVPALEMRGATLREGFRMGSSHAEGRD
jgi:hypothetical protein